MKASSHSFLWVTSVLVITFLSEISAQASPSPSPSPTTITRAFQPTTRATTTTSTFPTSTGLPFSEPLPQYPTFPADPRDNRTSPSFPDSEYVKLLDYTLLFYEAQRAGRLPANQRVTWRNNSVLTDGQDVGLDLSAVGISTVDNNYWGPDTNIPLPRPSYQVNITNPGTDIMADAAAAFASCAVLYRDKLNDTAYSNTLQTHATSLFNLAETARPQQVYQNVVTDAACCYASSGFVDELAWGAAWMYRLTMNPVYAQKASNYVNQFNAGGIQTSPITWDDKTGLIYILMANTTIGTSNINSQWVRLATQFGDVTVAARDPCEITNGGMYYCTGNSGDDSSVVAANAALAMYLLADVLESTGGSASKIKKYRSFALQQNDYLLGNNPMKTPYVVGVHPNSPQNPHSAPASGGTDVGDIDNSPEIESHTIYGALVGGPDRNDRFEDVRDNWKQTEVALDYNAPFNGLMAYQVMTSKLSPPYVVIPSGRPELPPILNGMEIWQIILIIIGAIFVIIGIGAFVCYRRRNQIRAWAAARRQRKTRKAAANHPLKPMAGSNSRQNISS
ncbi:hypothetical protein BGZ80_009037, partial [Entomortierella chlamydospora]